MVENEVVESVATSLKRISSDVEIDSQTDSTEGVVYFTLEIDNSRTQYETEYNSHKAPNSAVFIDGSYIAEFDIRFGHGLSIEDVEKAVSELSRGRRWFDLHNGGKVNESIPHITARDTRMRVGEFIQLVEDLVEYFEEKNMISSA